jgi:hypothetical protein
MSDYETLFFLERQEAFWKGRKLSGKAGSFLEKQEAFWCITRPVMDPLGPFGTLGPFGPFGPFGTLVWGASRLLEARSFVDCVLSPRNGRLVLSIGHCLVFGR